MENCAYEEITQIDKGENQETFKSWKPPCRQLMVCSALWNLYVIPGLFAGVPPVFVAQTRRDANSTEAVSTEMASWVSSALDYGAIPWVLILPTLAYFYGRKVSFWLLAVTGFASCSVLYFSATVIDVLISELMVGMFVASHTTVAVMMIAEYTSPRFRGVFLTLKSASNHWAIWIANAVGVFFHWRYIAIIGFVSCIFFLTGIFWPESPYWLAYQGKFDECAASHRWLKGEDRESEQELEILINSAKKHYTKRSKSCYNYRKFKDTISRKDVYRPLLISFPLLAMYDCSGKIVCTMYILDIVKALTDSESTANTTMLILDGVTVLGMYLGCAASKFLNRRTIFLGCSAVAIMFLYVISTYLYLIKLSIISKNDMVLISLLTGYSMFISIGPMLMITTVYGEIIPPKFSNEVSICGALFHVIFSGIMTKCAPSIFIALGFHGTFLFYGISCNVIVLILYKYLPETKDKTLQEISDWFKGEPTEPSTSMNELKTLQG